MRPEKQYLINEAVSHISSSNYVFLLNFTGVTVADASTFRRALATKGAEFHIVKNTILDIAAKAQELPDLSEFLAGPTAVIAGGESVTEVAKIIVDFVTGKENANVKVGVLDKNLLDTVQIEELSALPNLDGMKAKFLSLMLLASPQGVLNLLKAKSEKED